ncbi:MAG: iron ABC transporter permease [Candidatus Omnitrophica bacterium]|nr:iron ABC transporter permease [Candidatus Omnitrophota bacterium]
MKIKEIYSKTRRKTLTTMAILGAILLLSFFICSMLGAVFIAPVEFVRRTSLSLIQLRLSRVFLGIVAGASLSVAGTVFQGLLRNPLAEPYILGVSSGAGLGAVIAIILGLDKILPLVAFLGALLTIILVYNLAKTQKGAVPIRTLILAGVIVSAVFSSILMFLVSVSQSRRIHDIIWWLLGNLQIFDARLLITVSVTAVLGISITAFFARELNAIALGEEQAQNLGINVELVKRILFVVASLITAVCVSSCGIIGFVGLIIPHALRLVVGSDHRILIPAACLGGASFLIISDLFCRTIILPAEMPVGVVTALVGGPLFIYLLRKKSRDF